MSKKSGYLHKTGLGSDGFIALYDKRKGVSETMIGKNRQDVLKDKYR
ncbi:hypothetical protein GCWU000341_01310 [Oribacterium sp. oral taxon 078 str. F0262]|nr:hypothetical protein GCWU000341_01310 [Oribacterium sp. oral taxon 078 str. F0262]